ncbi:MAG: Ig-like domain-containing protein, partial [Acidobacteriota bacterium]
LTPVSDERLHQLEVDATDRAGNTTHATVHFVVDKSAPVISILEDEVALRDGATFNRDVIPVIQVSDLTTVTTSSALDGAPFVSGTRITATGRHALTVQSSDSATHTATVTLSFTIDRSGPALTITSPKNGDILGDPHVTVTGSAATATSVTVNGIAATLDPVAKTYSATLTLQEGTNTITVSGADSGGNPGTATIAVSIDTLAPQLTVTSPIGLCVSDAVVRFGGTVADPHLREVSVTAGGITVQATVVAASGTWSADIPNLAEGKTTLVATASDILGHTKSASLPVTIDRTPPVVRIEQNGAPFTAQFVRTAVAFAVAVTDADSNPSLTITLDDAPYLPGTPLASEGPHVLDAIAVDCAGLPGEKRVAFTLDSTAPSIRITESNRDLTDNQLFGGDVLPQVDVSDGGSGVRTVEVRIDNVLWDGTNPVTTEGSHQLDVDAADVAGNSAHLTLHFRISRTAPVISITESGAPLNSGTIFRRDVTPVIAVTGTPPITLSALLDNAPY